MKNLFIIFLFLLAVASVNAQQTDDEINIETSIVVVPFKVTDRNDKNIPDLKKEDFRVFENKIEQEIVGFDDSFAPFTIALALDVSDSTRFQLNDIKSAAIAFLKELRPHDRLIIYTFDNHIRRAADLKNNDLANAQNTIALSFTGGKTALYDMIGEIIGKDFKNIGGKKALIIFSDGIDTDSRRESYASSLRMAEESGVLTFPIQYNTLEDSRKAYGKDVQIVTAKGEPLPIAYARATQYLRILAGNTGGDFYYADTTANLENTFSKIAKQLSQIYSLSYYQPENQTAKKRRIKIETKVSQAVVNTRKNNYEVNSSKKKN